MCFWYEIGIFYQHNKIEKPRYELVKNDLYFQIGKNERKKVDNCVLYYLKQQVIRYKIFNNKKHITHFTRFKMQEQGIRVKITSHEYIVII